MLRKIIILSLAALCAFSAMAEEECNYYARILKADLSNVDLEDIKNSKLQIHDEMNHAQTVKRLDHYAMREDGVYHYYMEGHGKSSYFSIEPRGNSIYLEFTLYEKNRSFLNFGSSHDVHSQLNLVLDVDDVFKEQDGTRHSSNYNVELQAGIKAEFHFRRECFRVRPTNKHTFF